MDHSDYFFLINMALLCGEERWSVHLLVLRMLDGNMEKKLRLFKTKQRIPRCNVEIYQMGKIILSLKRT